MSPTALFVALSFCLRRDRKDLDDGQSTETQEENSFCSFHSWASSPGGKHTAWIQPLRNAYQATHSPSFDPPSRYHLSNFIFLTVSCDFSFSQQLSCQKIPRSSELSLVPPRLPFPCSDWMCKRFSPFFCPWWWCAIFTPVFRKENKRSALTWKSRWSLRSERCG